MTSTTVPLSAGRSTAVPSTDVPSTVGHQSVRRRRLRRGMVGGLVATALVLVGSAASASDDVPAGRRIVDHTVRAGETATGLAVRYHAWTAELIRRNHLGSGGGLVVGQRLEIPVVVAALPHRRADRRVTHHTPRHATHHDRGAARRGAPAARPPAGSSPGTATVRHAVAGAATRLGVDPQLALAVSWQESGWQMDRRSDAGAVGAMQVLPTSGAWMELYAGHELHLRRLHDNVTAGVTLLRVLADETRSTRRAVAAYYQGLGAVREHGLYGETRAYVADVTALRARLEGGRPPA